ncbi:embryo-specific protein ATS3A-like [Cucurbita maxima]|uniref:Embryo-specific protein ATS3A-like n=1 Tax=Cucurbita maxima TaxID=3661 RepID=A0A6J1L2N6_CUCMA|nr:embryo-specific protein ATS3A-like [Cucurbita maxima]
MPFSGGTAPPFCALLLLSLLAAGNCLASTHEKACMYAVTVETTCTKGADTSNHVSLRFGDTNSNDIVVGHLNSKHVRRVDSLEPQVLDDMPRKPFQACMVDHFQVTAKCVTSPICYLYLKVAGADDWRPGFVHVRLLESPHLSSNNFYFRRVLPRHVWHGLDTCRGDVTPFGIKRSRKVFAASKHFLRHKFN